MKRTVRLLKTYFETGDQPTESQFADLIDSFLHKDTGVVIRSHTVANNGDITVDFSDNTSITIEKYTHPASHTQNEVIGLVTKLQQIDTAITALQTEKVNTVNGKGLSTNDFTNALKTKLQGLRNYSPPASHPISFITGLQTALNTINASLTDKVDKETGKGLSQNDYTDAEKTKLQGIATGAEANVQADWNQTDSNKDDFIKNKPNLSSKVDKQTGKDLSSNDFTDGEKIKLSTIASNAEINVQSDWNQTDNTKDDFIKNKPNLSLKVDKVNGKGLSTNDFTDADRNKLNASIIDSGFKMYHNNVRLEKPKFASGMRTNRGALRIVFPELNNALANFSFAVKIISDNGNSNFIRYFISYGRSGSSQGNFWNGQAYALKNVTSRFAALNKRIVLYIGELNSSWGYHFFYVHYISSFWNFLDGNNEITFGHENNSFKTHNNGIYTIYPTQHH